MRNNIGGDGRRHDDDHDEVDMGHKLAAPPDFDGPASYDERRFTDVLCALLLWSAWMGMTALGIYAMKNGDYRVILHPLDYAGNLCGTEKGALNMTDYPYLYYVNDYGGGVCVKECPTFPGGGFDPHTLVTYDGLYRAATTAAAATSAATNESSSSSVVGTSERISLPDYSYTNNTLSCTSGLCYPDTNDPRSAYTSLGVNRGMGFAYFAVDTYELMWRCVFTAAGKAGLQAIINPNNNSSNNNNGTAGEEEEFDTMDPITRQRNEIIKAGYRLWDNLYSDIWMTRYYILTFGFGLPLVVGFGYAYMMRLPGVLPILVWTSIFATVGIFVGAGYYTSRIANTWKIAIPRVYTDREIEIAIYSSYGLYTVGGLLVLLFLFMRKRIQLAMGCVEETSKAMLQMPLILFFPVVQGLGFLVFMICWTVYAVSIASMGEFQTTTYTATSLQISVRSFEFSDFVVKCGWYMLFSFFWTGQFILALGQVVFAMAVSKWYFARDKSTIGSGTVLSSISTSIIYHSGTAAFGALIIACIKMIRSCIAYLQRKAEEMNSGIAKCILCCFQCCFLCLEKCMKFMNKNAYIQTAIFGSSFCTSAKDSFFLILRNASRIAAISYVSGGVVFVGKIFISSFTTGIAYYVIEKSLAEHLYSVTGPLVVIAVISWFIAGMFMSVYDMGIATILQCFVADEEMFEEEERYAEGGLKAWVDSHE